MKVVYTQQAKSQTDSPTDFVTFMNQQTRWGKSYFREIFYSLACLDRQNFWLGWELFYRTFYFFLVSFWAMYLLYFADIKTQATALLVMTGFGILRTLFGVIIMRDARFLFFTLYSYIYFFIIIPTKITALLTMRETGWGTRGSFAGELKRFFGTIVAIIWLLAVLCGVAFTIYKNPSFNWADWNYRFAFIALIVYISYLVSCLVAYGVLQKCGFLSNPTQKWLNIDIDGQWERSTYSI
jgi:hyaluronan synthase